MKTPNPRRPIAFPCYRRLLYVYSKSFRVFSLSHLHASASQLSFQVTFPSLPPSRAVPALKYRARRSWIFGAGVSVAKLSRRHGNKIARGVLPRILRAAIHGASFAKLFISSAGALRNLTSVGRLSGWHARFRLTFVDSTWCSS